MLETNVIGNKEWAKGLFCEEDIRHLEAFDSDMRDRHMQRNCGSGTTSTFESLADEHADEIPLHCEHGIPLFRKCALCQSFPG